METNTHIPQALDARTAQIYQVRFANKTPLDRVCAWLTACAVFREWAVFDSQHFDQAVFAPACYNDGYQLTVARSEFCCDHLRPAEDTLEVAVSFFVFVMESTLLVCAIPSAQMFDLTVFASYKVFRITAVMPYCNLATLPAFSFRSAVRVSYHQYCLFHLSSYRLLLVARVKRAVQVFQIFWVVALDLWKRDQLSRPCENNMTQGLTKSVAFCVRVFLDDPVYDVR